MRSKLKKIFSLFLLFTVGSVDFLLAQEIRSWQILTPYTLAEDVVAEDVTCNHSALIIQAEVTGKVFAIGCELTIGQNSLLHHGVTFSGGYLKVDQFADIFGDITQIGGRLDFSPEANLRGVIHQYQNASEPPSEVANISERYLTFRRVVPMDSEHLERALQELQMMSDTPFARESLHSFVVPEFLEFLFKEDNVRYAQKIMFTKDHAPLELQALEFVSLEQSRWFWKNILSFTNLKLSRSVQNNLGDGGHWFFRFKNRSSLLWHRANWFFSMQVSMSPENLEEDWTALEKVRDTWIQQFQRALMTNGGVPDNGDHYIEESDSSSQKE